MGASTNTATRHLQTEEFAVFPFDPTKVNYTNNVHEIDPSRQYPKSYQEFMTREGTWDLFGLHHYAFDDISMITEQEVEEIMMKR